jgi:arylsulfatase I/J
MVKLLDDILKTLVQKLQDAGLWDNTLLVFTSDNGGPNHLEESGATNFDLRGGKYSDWEGGVRAAAFVSGGYLPHHRRGITIEQPVHICDWYKTLPMLAGVDVMSSTTLPETSRVPPVDAVNVWPLLMGQVETSPRHEIPLSQHSLIVGDYKLIWKDQVKESGWTGSLSPNASSVPDDTVVNCSSGCLFHVARDRGEHFNLASEEPQRVQVMKERLIELRKGFFENDDRGLDSCPPDIDMPCACWMAVNYYGGFFGPYQEIDIDWKSIE